MTFFCISDVSISGPHISGCRIGALAVAASVMLSACVQAPVVAPPPPDLPAKTIHYTCAGNSHVTVAYGAGKITLAGPETLIDEDGSGQRYSWPSDGTHHVWALSGGLGTLSLRDGTNGTEKVVQSGCKADAKAS